MFVFVVLCMHATQLIGKLRDSKIVATTEGIGSRNDASQTQTHIFQISTIAQCV